MAARYVICPLCGFEFEPADTLCQHGCPLRTTCGLLRCPGCEFEFPERPRAVSWLGRLLGRRPPAASSVCDLVLTIGELAAGERAEVVSLLGAGPRQSRLAVFGLVPGSEIVLLQTRPAFVLRVGETELAIDREIAGGILVRRASATRKGSPPP